MVEIDFDYDLEEIAVFIFSKLVGKICEWYRQAVTADSFVLSFFGRFVVKLLALS